MLLLLLFLLLLLLQLQLRRLKEIRRLMTYRGGRGLADTCIIIFIVVAAEWPIPAVSRLSCWPQSGRSPHSHFYHSGHGGVADPRIPTSIVVATEWVADPRILNSIVVAAEWPIPHSHFYSGGRGVADPRILTSIVMAAERPIPHSHFYRWPRSGRPSHSRFDRGGRGVADPRILASVAVATEWPIPAFALLS